MATTAHLDDLDLQISAMRRIIAAQERLVLQLENEGQHDLAERAQQQLEGMQTELERLKVKRAIGEASRRPKAISRAIEEPPAETKKRAGS